MAELRAIYNVRGPQGVPGGGSDADTADWVESGTLTSAALEARYGALGRLDRQNIAGIRTGAGDAGINYSDAAEFSTSWADFTGVTNATNAQVSANRLYAVNTSSTAGVMIPFASLAGEHAHITGTFQYISAASGNLYFGIDVGASGHAPASGSPDAMFLGFSGLSRGIYRGANVNTIAMTTKVIGSNPTGTTTFSWSIDIDDYYVSLSMKQTDADDSFYTAFISRAALATAGKTINNIGLYVVDTRALSGHSFGPVAAVHSRQPTRTKSLASVAIEGVSHRHVVTSDQTAGNGWRYALPLNYDPRAPSPVVIFSHQAGGTQHTPWDESRARPVAKALLDAGYIVATASDGGDLWGNATSLANYQLLYTRLRDTYNTGPLFLLGVSMGLMSSLNALARRSMPTPAAVASIDGVCDLDSILDEASLLPGIKTAYGIASDMSDYDTQTAGWNPIDRAGWEFRGVPFRFYASTADTWVPKATNADVMAAKMLPYVPEAAIVVGSAQHLDVTAYQAADLVTFFNTYR